MRRIPSHRIISSAKPSEGEVDLKDVLWGSVFEPLKDRNRFRQFKVHPDLHTIVWENGADFSPEFLYSCIRATA
ncbi:MAG: DUF2442 domain-containing protein [Bacteroidota bacterium]